MSVHYLPENMSSLSPYLVCRDAAAAIDFYVRAFGAVELGRFAGDDGRILHAELRISDASLMVSDEWPDYGAVSPQALNGSPVTLHLYVPDVDAAMARAVAAGATVTMPVADMFWGDRYGKLSDPFGHQWSLATHQREVSFEEMQAAAAAQCG